MLYRKVLQLCVAIFIVAFVVAACGSPSTPATATQGAATSAAPSATPRLAATVAPTATAVPVSSGSLIVALESMGNYGLMPDIAGNVQAYYL